MTFFKVENMKWIKRKWIKDACRELVGFLVKMALEMDNA
jgi:hypothetical protein